MTCSIKDCSEEFTRSSTMRIIFFSGLEIDRDFYVSLCKRHEDLIPDPESDRQVPIETRWWKRGGGLW